MALLFAVGSDGQLDRNNIFLVSQHRYLVGVVIDEFVATLDGQLAARVVEGIVLEPLIEEVLVHSDVDHVHVYEFVL